MSHPAEMDAQKSVRTVPGGRIPAPTVPTGYLIHGHPASPLTQ
jgi:hypothetical protein